MGKGLHACHALRYLESAREAYNLTTRVCEISVDESPYLWRVGVAAYASGPLRRAMHSTAIATYKIM